jgi:hypothetical protein
MHVSAVRLASILSSRLTSKVPAPFEFRADGANFIVDHPDCWGLTMPLAWIEAPDEDRSGSELAELIVGNALNTVQDAVSESQTEPWPALEAQGSPRTMAPYGTRCDGLNIYFWYGTTEADPTIAFAPIPLADVTREESVRHHF